MRWLFLAVSLITPAYSIIDNAEINLTSRDAVPLRGVWDFRALGKAANTAWKRLRVDKEWRLQGIEKISQGEFRLKITIPSPLRSGDFGLILPPVSAALRIFLNDRLVAAKGVVAESVRYPQNSSEAFAWYPIKRETLLPGATQTLRLEMTGFQGGGGIYGNAHIYFGGLEEIRDKYNFIFITTVFLAAAIFMIAVFHFALVPDRNYRRANLHYVLLSLAMAFHIIGMNGLGYYLFNNFLFNAALIHLIVAAFPFALVGFSLRYFRLQFPLIRISAYVYGATMSLLLLALVFFPDAIPFYLEYGLPAGVAAMALSLCFALYGAVRGVLEKIEGARLVFAGLTVYGAAVLNDVLFYFSYATSLKLADAGFLFAVVCIAIALAERLQRAAQEKDELREWKKEVSLAAQIQNLALAKRSLRTSHLSAETLFKPMKIIGGDFFAFHEISDQVTGIFIADVSGHGIAAALMVNSIQSTFLQQRDCAHDPAEFMRRMNRALYPQLREQFITAAYCALDFGAGKIRVAQAGHPPIYLLQQNRGGLEKVKPKGRFFGFEPEIDYEMAELSLAAYSRIFLYSDGVIEAGSGRGSPYTGTRLENFLVSSAGLDGSRLLSGLEEDIKTHAHTQMNTDDDSSCIVVDLKAA